VASLGTVNSQLVRMTSLGGRGPDRAGRAGARPAEQVDALSAGMKEAYGTGALSAGGHGAAAGLSGSLGAGSPAPSREDHHREQARPHDGGGGPALMMSRRWPTCAATTTNVSDVACSSPAAKVAWPPTKRRYSSAGSPRNEQDRQQEGRHAQRRGRAGEERVDVDLHAADDEEERDEDPERRALELARQARRWRSRHRRGSRPR